MRLGSFTIPRSTPQKKVNKNEGGIELAVRKFFDELIFHLRKFRSIVSPTPLYTSITTAPFAQRQRATANFVAASCIISVEGAKHFARSGILTMRQRGFREISARALTRATSSVHA